jgi:hypothetical protein
MNFMKELNILSVKEANRRKSGQAEEISRHSVLDTESKMLNQVQHDKNRKNGTELK